MRAACWWQRPRRTATVLRPPPSPSLTMARDLWGHLLEELHRRGAGERESGAFLLTRRRNVEAPVVDEVIAIAYYDDLDAHCLTGGITMAGTAYDGLWNRCRIEGLRVAADIHTHPGSRVTQSPIDRANPMMAHAGHIALIVGQYADPHMGDPPLGMYRYLGNRTWRELDVREHLLLPDESARRRWWTLWLRQRSRPA